MRSPGGAAASQQMEQLQILYKARGHKLDEVQSSLDTVREESERETRILKHRLTMAQGKGEGGGDTDTWMLCHIWDSKMTDPYSRLTISH